MDKASDFGSEDCRFESCHGRRTLFLCHHPAHLSFLLVCVCACLPVCLSACLPVCLSACLPVCLSAVCACLPVCLSACLPVAFVCACVAWRKNKTSVAAEGFEPSPSK